MIEPMDIIDRIEARQEQKRHAELQALIDGATTPEEVRYHIAFHHVAESFLMTGGFPPALKEELMEATRAHYARERGE